MTKIRLGDQNLNDNIDDTNTYEIEKTVAHPNYMGWGPQYDLAIVYTKTKIQFNDRIKPICIPTKPYDEANKYANDEVKFAGWGYYDAVNDFSNDLREAAFKVLPQSQCFSAPLYEPRIQYKDLMFCAGNEVCNLHWKSELLKTESNNFFAEWSQLVMWGRFWFAFSENHTSGFWTTVL